MRGHRLTDEQVATIRELTEKNELRYKIAEIVGCSENTVTAYQKRYGILPACKRTTNNGKTLKQCPPVLHNEAMVTEPKEPEPFRFDSIVITDKILDLSGSGTGFTYHISTRSDEVVISTRYGDPFKIDVSDMVAFAKEIAQVAMKLDKMKKDVWSD